VRTEDGYIINKCLNGNSAAFGFLVDKYKASVYAFAYSELRNFHDAEDVTQEVFVKAYQKLKTLRRWDNFLAWLYSITSNLCKMWIRSKSRRPDRDFIEDQDPETLNEPSINPYDEDSVFETLHEALNSLPDTYRQVLTLYYLGGMDSNEIARFLGTSPTAVRHRLSRARLQLREEMVGMMSETFEVKKLQASFTFRIVEAVKRINVNPVPVAKGLPWGLSLATGIIVAFLSIGTHLSFINPTGSMSGSLLPGESKVLKVGEIPVDVLKVSNISVLSNQQLKGTGLGSVVPSLQNALFMAPQAEGGTWTKKTDMPTNRGQLSISEVNGKIYVIGGVSKVGGPFSLVEEYDPATDKWTRKADMPTSRYFLATSVVNRKIYAIGGEKLDGVFSAVEEYDPVSDKWTEKTDLPFPRTCLSACTANGKIYAIGGMAARANWLSADVEEYDPITNTWTRKADMPTPRMCLCTVTVNGKIYAIGGLPGNWPPTAVMEEYDPVSDTWTKKADMITPRTYFTTVVINEKILAIGGTKDWSWPGDAILAPTMEEYDPIADKWTEKGNMPEPRMYCPASLVNGKIYVIGGLSAKNQIMTIVEEYDPNAVGKSINFKGKLPTTWGDVRTALNK